MSYRPKDHQERVVHRLKIIQGHLAKVTKMVNEGQYCIDIIHQSLAVQKALGQVDRLILENHLKSCVAKAFSKGEHSQAISEVVEVFRKTQ